jgi:hypothetical protein
MNERKDAEHFQNDHPIRGHLGAIGKGLGSGPQLGAQAIQEKDESLESVDELLDAIRQLLMPAGMAPAAGPDSHFQDHAHTLNCAAQDHTKYQPACDPRPDYGPSPRFQPGFEGGDETKANPAIFAGQGSGPRSTIFNSADAVPMSFQPNGFDHRADLRADHRADLKALLLDALDLGKAPQSQQSQIQGQLQEVQSQHSQLQERQESQIQSQESQAGQSQIQGQLQEIQSQHSRFQEIQSQHSQLQERQSWGDVSQMGQPAQLSAHHQDWLGQAQSQIQGLRQPGPLGSAFLAEDKSRGQPAQSRQGFKPHVAASSLFSGQHPTSVQPIWTPKNHGHSYGHRLDQQKNMPMSSGLDHQKTISLAASERAFQEAQSHTSLHKVPQNSPHHSFLHPPQREGSILAPQGQSGSSHFSHPGPVDSLPAQGGSAHFSHPGPVDSLLGQGGSAHFSHPGPVDSLLGQGGSVHFSHPGPVDSSFSQSQGPQPGQAQGSKGQPSILSPTLPPTLPTEEHKPVLARGPSHRHPTSVPQQEFLPDLWSDLRPDSCLGQQVGSGQGSDLDVWQDPRQDPRYSVNGAQERALCALASTLGVARGNESRPAKIPARPIQDPLQRAGAGFAGQERAHPSRGTGNSSSPSMGSRSSSLLSGRASFSDHALTQSEASLRRGVHSSRLSDGYAHAGLADSLSHGQPQPGRRFDPQTASPTTSQTTDQISAQTTAQTAPQSEPPAMTANMLAHELDNLPHHKVVPVNGRPNRWTVVLGLGLSLKRRLWGGNTQKQWDGVIALDQVQMVSACSSFFLDKADHSNQQGQPAQGNSRYDPRNSAPQKATPGASRQHTREQASDQARDQELWDRVIDLVDLVDAPTDAMKEGAPHLQDGPLPDGFSQGSLFGDNSDGLVPKDQDLQSNAFPGQSFPGKSFPGKAKAAQMQSDPRHHPAHGPRHGAGDQTRDQTRLKDEVESGVGLADTRGDGGLDDKVAASFLRALQPAYPKAGHALTEIQELKALLGRILQDPLEGLLQSNQPALCHIVMEALVKTLAPAIEMWAKDQLAPLMQQQIDRLVDQLQEGSQS